MPSASRPHLITRWQHSLQSDTNKPFGQKRENKHENEKCEVKQHNPIKQPHCCLEAAVEDEQMSELKQTDKGVV